MVVAASLPTGAHYVKAFGTQAGYGMMSTLSRAMLFPLLELSCVPVQVMVRV